MSGLNDTRNIAVNYFSLLRCSAPVAWHDLANWEDGAVIHHSNTVAQSRTVAPYLFP